MFSLASLRYRGVMAARGGPIAKVEMGEFPMFGRRLFQANARLIPGLVPRGRAKLYHAEADGTGAHVSPMVARHMAVSESLERWAFHATVRSDRRAEFGFDVDETSNGMAAFPGLSAAPARRSAVLESLERFCLLHWWEGKIDGQLRDTEWPGVSALAFEPSLGGVAVLLFARSEWGFHVYGHAAAESFTRACERAMLELTRHEWVLSNRLLALGQGTSEPITERLEKRSWFFSTEAGHELFRERLARKATGPMPQPRVVCDREVTGPWSDYTTVWRFVLQPPSRRFMEEGERYFFW
ncbi:MAG: hypothetical protein K9M98_04850 [Cephaloticoccus sp.]|nr:hypothetical protein [Cephaloticoccus sp.]MCF7759810.1 hypothetical protein [Cephaloticoccus sp.]